MTDCSGVAVEAAGGRDELAAVCGPDLTISSLRPLLEGARARGVADACELLGAGAVLLDRSGVVLHLSSLASALMGGALSVIEGHVVAAEARANQAIERLVALALTGLPGEFVVEGVPAIRVRILPMPGAGSNEAQLLKAVLFVSRLEDAAPSEEEDAPSQEEKMERQAFAA